MASNSRGKMLIAVLKNKFIVCIKKDMLNNADTLMQDDDDSQRLLDDNCTIGNPNEDSHLSASYSSFKA